MSYPPKRDKDGKNIKPEEPELKYTVCYVCGESSGSLTKVSKGKYRHNDCKSLEKALEK